MHTKTFTLIAILILAYIAKPVEAQFTIEPTISEEGEIGGLDDLPEGTECLQRKSSIVADTWAYYPITTGYRKTFQGGGWGYPYGLGDEQLAGVARLNLLTGQMDYCRIPEQMRAPYQYGEVFACDGDSVCFNVISSEKVVKCIWSDKDGVNIQKERFPRKEVLPFVIRSFDLERAGMCCLRVKQPALIQDSLSGYIAFWFDADGFHVGEFSAGNWLWLYGIESIRNASGSREGEPIRMFKPNCTGRNSVIPIMVVADSQKTSSVVLLGKGICELVLKSEWNGAPDGTFLSPDGNWFLISENNQSMIKLLNLNDKSVKVFRNKESRWVTGLTNRAIFFETVHGDLHELKLDSWETTRYQRPLLPGEQRE